MKVMVSLIVLLCADGIASVCMSTNGTTQGLSVYQRVCCVIDNLGRSHTIRGDGITQYILCPTVQPKSCSAIRDCKIWYENGYTVNGNYTIYPDGDTPVEVYCDMEGINCDGGGGWTRVAYLNMTEPNATCPTGLSTLSYENFTHNLCGKPSFTPHCVSTVFSTRNLTYSKVCGQVRGYQYGRIFGFHNLGIDGPYIAGVSLTHGALYKHIWSYVGAFTEDNHNTYGCPCSTGYNGQNRSSLVGSHYYCESGTNIDQQGVFYSDDPLWDGQQCNSDEASCCPVNSTMPWFYRLLDTHTTDDIKLRVCAAGNGKTDQTPLDIIELYIM